MCVDSYYLHFDKVLPKVLLAELSVNIVKSIYSIYFFKLENKSFSSHVS